MNKSIGVLTLLMWIFLASCTTAPSKSQAPSFLPTFTPYVTQTITFTTTSTDTPTIVPSFTASPFPTPTDTPTPSPTPLGGGGSLVLTLNKRVYSQSFNMSGESNIFVAEPDGTNLTPITSGEENISEWLEDVSPDGSTILFTRIPGEVWRSSMNGTRGNLYAADIDGSRLVQLNDVGTTVYRSSSRWLPDGRIVFIGVSTQGRAVYSVNSDGTGLTTLTNTMGKISGIAKILWVSPDGTGIYWVAGGWCADRGICNEAYFFTQLDGSVHKNVWTWLKATSDHISVSPDGNMIAYQPYFGQDPESREQNACFVSDIDEKNIQKISPNDCRIFGKHYQAAWSPDGKYLIYRFSSHLARIGSQDYRYKMYSVVDEQSVDLPVSDRSYRNDAVWFSDSRRVILYESNNSSYALAIILDLKSNQVVEIPGSAACAVEISPDELKLWLYDCKETGIFAMYDLTTQTTRALFEDLKMPEQGEFYVWERFNPAQWVKASRK
jgi:Tol biopolymer transport system component